jgi:autotransporter-associated beta strand protein
LFNSYGLGDGLAAKTVTLTRAELQLQGGLDIPAALSFVTSGGALANSPGGELIPIRNISGNNTVQGAISLGSGGGDTVIASDSGILTLNGTVTPGAAAASRALILSGAGTGVLNGAFNDNTTFIGLLTKQGSGTWVLNNVNNYSGATTIQNGALTLGASALITNTPTIQLLSNAVLNVSAVTGGFTLGTNQTLKGNGTVQGGVAAAGAVIPGTSVGTLNFTAGLVLSGTTVMELNRTNGQNADLISAASITFGGDLTVTNIGEDLQPGDTFNLFDGAITGQFASTNLPALSSTNLQWDVSLLGTQGILKIASNVASQPTITPSRNGTNIVLQVVSEAGFNYVVEATPILAPATWTGIQTNAGGGTLTFTIPINPSAQKQFFRVRVQ